MHGVTLAAALCLGTTAFATDLNLTCDAEGCEASTITVGPLCETAYRVTGELTDDATQGLAIVIFDLEFDGGALSQANEPTALPMLNFFPPEGFSRNPDGFGGTPVDGVLLQVGGAQNIFNHGQWECDDDQDCPRASLCNSGICTSIPGLPLGMVITDVAQPGEPVLLVTGTLTTPAAEGTYTLSLTNLQANAITQDATGEVFWATESVGTGAVTNLTITVEEGAPCCGEVFVACCLSDGSCAEADPNDCTANLGGIPQGLDSVCEGDADGDGFDGTCGDACPDDPDKLVPGVCGCGFPDTDTDGDTVPDCVDLCPGEDDLLDANGDGIPDCLSMAIPTVSGWGLVILSLLLLTGSKLYFRCSFQA
jgi:hypothetical protein